MMKIFHVLLFLLSVSLFSCKNEPKKILKTQAERIAVDKSIKEDQEISDFIAPYKKHLNATLDSALAYNPTYLSKNNGDLNTAIGNLMADAVFIQARPVFKKMSGKDIDMVLLNHGGIRAEIPEGKVSTRTAYNIMPFENEIVVAQLTGKQVKQMLKYLEKAKTAHPVSGIKILADKKYRIIEATIHAKKIEDNNTYFVATSDYLANGGDNMTFFEDPVQLYNTNYKIRNALIDYFKKTDTIRAKIDGRYIRN